MPSRVRLASVVLGLTLLSPRSCVAAAAINFGSTRWAALQKHLDTLPVFTCVNAEGEPLGYERDGEPLAIYFADAERAQQELATMSEKFPSLDLRLLGAGLGAVFRQHTEGSALLVPGAAALAGAGDDFDSDKLPLYTCLSMSSPAPEGSRLEPAGALTTPLFLDPQDAQIRPNLHKIIAQVAANVNGCAAVRADASHPSHGQLLAVSAIVSRMSPSR